MYLYVLPRLSGQRVESRLLEVSDAPYSFAFIPVHHDEEFVTSHIHNLIGVDTAHKIRKLTAHPSIPGSQQLQYTSVVTKVTRMRPVDFKLGQTLHN